MTTRSGAAARARRERDQAIISAAFEISLLEIVADARKVLAWNAPRDDLLVSICGDHGWAAEMGVVYLAWLQRSVDPAARAKPWAWSCA
jgi:hypothetical protein